MGEVTTRTSGAGLWADWCAATGHDPTVVTVPALTAHLTACPAPSRPARRARVRSILAAAPTTATDVRDRVLGTPTAPDSAFRTGPGWLSAGEALARIDPDDAVGRRDAFLLVLLGRISLTRTQAVTLAADQIDVPDEDRGTWPSITGVDVPFDPDPGRCPCCALTRWVDTLGAYVANGRAGVKDLLVHDSTMGHVCSGVPRSTWRTAETLLPGIDRHGWFGAPLTPRSVSAVMARRQGDPGEGDPAATGWGPAERGGPSPHMGTRPEPDSVLDDALDRLDDALETTLARVEALVRAADST